MTKRKHNLIIVSILLALLLGLLFFLISMPAPEKNASTEEIKPTFENIIDMTDRKIISVAVKNPQESYEIKSETKDDKQVYILSDQDESKTSQSNASAMFDTLINLKPTQVIENAEDLSTYGLAESNAELTVTFENNEKVTLYLGNDAPLSKGTYMKIAGSSKIYLISPTDKEIFLNEKSFYEEKAQN